jgi:AcrR family transcriptional regulator
MRITEEAKKHNRARILETAGRLFATKGFSETTTRDIAREAGLAVGTMFNYFPSKESMAMSMVNEALARALVDFRKAASGDEELTEELFLFISTALRRLRPFHPFIGPVLEKSLSPFAAGSICPEGESTRKEHLAMVRAILARHGCVLVPDAITVHIYWSLYLGILAFWSHDDSPSQEATIALVDYSLTLFTRMLVNADPMLPDEDVGHAC